MQTNPTTWNGVPIPYGASISELKAAIAGPVPKRWAAIVAVAHTPGPAAIELLRELAMSPDSHIRRAAAEAIGQHSEGRQLRSTLLNLTFDPDEYVVRCACEVVANLGIEAAHDRLVTLLRSGASATRCSAVRALRRIWQESDFAEVFRISVHDLSVEVAKEAAWTLRERATALNWPALFYEWRTHRIPRHRVWACELAAAFGGLDVLSQVRQLLGDADGHVRLMAANALAQIEARGQVNE
jgi:HEAT repeat protein